MPPKEIKAGEADLYRQAPGMRVPEDLYGHPKLPPGNNQKSIKNMSGSLDPGGTPRTRKQQERTWLRKWSGSRNTKSEVDPYVDEPEHHAGLEAFIRDKLSQEGASPAGNEDPHADHAGQRHAQAGSTMIQTGGLGAASGRSDCEAWEGRWRHADMNARAFVSEHVAKFKKWIPGVFRFDQAARSRPEVSRQGCRHQGGPQPEQLARRGLAAPVGRERGAGKGRPRK